MVVTGLKSSFGETDPKDPHHFAKACGSGSTGIRINFPSWIRIRIQYADLDQDPGG